MNDKISTDKLVLAYPGVSGSQEIRTISEESGILFCLADVAMVLQAENAKLSKGGPRQGFKGYFDAQVNALAPDEQVFVREPPTRTYDLEQQIYVTQPGLFRVLLRDDGPACRNFQRWVLHEVLPSIQRHGTYPPPEKVDTGSEIRRATELLLEEIKARETLEKETKAQFAKHEAKLGELSQQLARVEVGDVRGEYETVDTYCSALQLGHSTLQHIEGWCFKLCFEGAIPIPKTQLARGTQNLYPHHVIEDAISRVMKP